MALMDSIFEIVSPAIRRKDGVCAIPTPNPERIRPQIHQFVEHKLSWFDILDNLPRVTGKGHPRSSAIFRELPRWRVLVICRDDQEAI
jgi:hypothetical protein